MDRVVDDGFERATEMRSARYHQWVDSVKQHGFFGPFLDEGQGSAEVACSSRNRPTSRYFVSPYIAWNLHRLSWSFRPQAQIRDASI